MTFLAAKVQLESQKLTWRQKAKPHAPEIFSQEDRKTLLAPPIFP